MILEMYAIRDVKTCFMTPTVERNRFAAVRNFMHAVKHTDGILHTNPEDFDLYCIGKYDSDSGIVEPFAVPELIVNGATGLAMESRKLSNSLDESEEV